MIKTKKKIVVAMSGGVDSSVVVALLKEEGHEVIGVTLKLCPYTNVEESKKVAKELSIKHYIYDLTRDFDKKIISYFVDTYLKGETPLPCAKCNRQIKFGALYEIAKTLGGDALATGHYIRKVRTKDGIELHKARDLIKDQSYFLFAIEREKLPFLEFPLGEYKKSEVRELAQRFELSVSQKPESQDICFIPDGNYSELINSCSTLGSNPGDIIDINGNILGAHKGIINYTVGQRKGLGISQEKPLYVVKIESSTNSVVVGNESDLNRKEFYIKDTNWFVDPHAIEGLPLTIKVRSMHKGVKGFIRLTNEREVYKVILLDHCKSIAPGQAGVLYKGSQLLGGGFICADSFII